MQHHLSGRKTLTTYISRILPIGLALATETDFDGLLARILREAQSICNADGGTLYLRTADDLLEFSIVRNDSLGMAWGGAPGWPEAPFPPISLYDPQSGAPNYRNVVTAAVLHDVPLNIPDVYAATDYDFSGARAFDAQHAYRTSSVLAIPLKNSAHQVMGVLQLINAKDPATGTVIPFDAGRQMLVELLAAQAAIALNSQLMMRRQAVLHKLEEDLHIGQDIQRRFLPESLPDLPGWGFAAAFEPAREVGADFYDVFRLQDGQIALVIADVCDKGVGPALFMALTRSLIRAFAEQTPGGIEGLARAVEHTNRYILNTHAAMNMFATLFVAALDPASGKLAYANCGHNAPLHRLASGELVKLPAAHPAIGILPDLHITPQRLELKPGEALIAFTDGVTDARNPDGERFTEARFLILLENAPREAGPLVGLIRATLSAFMQDAPPFDDITLLTVTRA